MTVYLVCAIQTGDPGFFVRAYHNKGAAEQCADILNKGSDYFEYVVEELEVV